MTELQVGIKHVRDGVERLPIINADMSVIGIIGTAPAADAGAFPFNTPKYVQSDDTDALELLGTTGTIIDAIKGVQAQLLQGGAKIVIVRVDPGVNTDATIAAVAGNSVSKTGIWAFTKAPQDLGLTPRLILASGWTAQHYDGVQSIAIGGTGTGYEVGDAITASGGGGTGFAAVIASVNGTGHPLTITITNPGKDYATAPTLACAGGTGATFTATVGKVANAVCAALPPVLSRLFAHAVVSGPTSSRQAWIDWRETLQSDRLIPGPCNDVLVADSNGAPVTKPADAIRLEHDGRLVDLRLVSIADAEARGIEAVRQDRATYDLPPGDPRAASLTRAVVFGTPEAVLMDLPQLTEDQPAHRPLIAAHAVPWPGEMAVFRSPSTDGFELLTTFGSRARIGTLVSDLYAGPTSRFDLGNTLVVDLLTGTLESVTDLTLFGGANALAIESAPDVWEIVQAGAAELLAPGRYRLTRLLRGQRGTEVAMGNPAPAGARVVVLDTALASLPIAEADLGIPWNWRIGPASRPVSDETYVAQTFTPSGIGLRPFSVVHVEQPWRKPRTSGDLTIRWIRRSRGLAADSWGGLEVPLTEELEAYEVEILDGATVNRVLGSTITSAVYTAAQQTADWGELLAPGDTLDIRIHQLSALVGRGAPKAVTLSF